MPPLNGHMTFKPYLIDGQLHTATISHNWPRWLSGRACACGTGGTDSISGAGSDPSNPLKRVNVRLKESMERFSEIFNVEFDF